MHFTLLLSIALNMYVVNLYISIPPQYSSPNMQRHMRLLLDDKVLVYVVHTLLLQRTP